MQEKSIITLLFILSISACTERQQSTQTPWGDTFGTDTVSSNTFSLRDIQESGEMVVLTISGPNTYYEYRGKQMGTQYLLCEKFAQKIGVSLRVEVCKSIDEMIKNSTQAMQILLYIRYRHPQKAQYHVAIVQTTES